MKQKNTKQPNFVLKHMNTVCRNTVHKNPIREQKLGNFKHKGKMYE